MKKKRLTIEIDADRHQELKMLAAEAKMSMKDIVVMLIGVFMDGSKNIEGNGNGK